MIKTKNNYIFFLLLIFVAACDFCLLSERCFRDREKNRIIDMSKEQKDNEKQKCIKEYEHMIKITKNEKKECNFWKCIDGKEDWKKRLENCVWRLENIK